MPRTHPEASVLRGLWRTITEHVPTTRILTGEVGTILGRIAARDSVAAAQHVEFSLAHWFWVTNGDPISRAWCESSIGELRTSLVRLRAQSDLRADIDLTLRDLDETLKAVRSAPAVRISSSSAPADWFDALRRASGGSPGFQEVLDRFDEALRHDIREVEPAANALRPWVAAMPESKPLLRELDEAVAHALRRLPGTDADRVLLKFYDALSVLRCRDKVREALKTVMRATRRDPAAWLRIAELAASRRPVGTIQGALGELVAKNTTAYRTIWRREMDRARLVAAQLGGGAKAVAVRRELRGPSSKGLRLFYDDAIFVVDRTTGKAHCVLATQVKAGRRSSREILEQLANDMRRERLRGTVEIDGVTYQIAQGDIAAPTRIFVGSVRPRRQSPAALDFVELPVGGGELRRIARILLAAARTR